MPYIDYNYFQYGADTHTDGNGRDLAYSEYCGSNDPTMVVNGPACEAGCLDFCGDPSFYGSGDVMCTFAAIASPEDQNWSGGCVCHCMCIANIYTMWFNWTGGVNGYWVEQIPCAGAGAGTGDINQDGVVNVLDVNRIVEIVIETGAPATQAEIIAGDVAGCNNLGPNTASWPRYEHCFDANMNYIGPGDGQLSVLDVIKITEMILGTGQQQPRSGGGRRSSRSNRGRRLFGTGGVLGNNKPVNKGNK